MISDAAVEATADVLAYLQVKSTNPKADSPIWGYYAFSDDQRGWLRDKHRPAARAALLKLVADWEAGGRAFALGGEVERQSWPPSPR